MRPRSSCEDLGSVMEWTLGFSKLASCGFRHYDWKSWKSEVWKFPGRPRISLRDDFWCFQSYRDALFASVFGIIQRKSRKSKVWKLFLHHRRTHECFRDSFTSLESNYFDFTSDLAQNVSILITNETEEMRNAGGRWYK